LFWIRKLAATFVNKQWDSIGNGSLGQSEKPETQSLPGRGKREWKDGATPAEMDNSI